MGYQLSGLSSLPIDDDVNLYIFVLGDGFQSAEYHAVQENFAPIASQIGEHAVLAQGFDIKKWTGELKSKYLGKGAWGMLPALLLTDTHPDRLRPDSLRMVIPLNTAVEKYGSLTAFFAALTAFARGERPDFLKDFAENKFLDAVKHANDVIVLQPNVMGFGINLNNAVGKWIERRRER